MVGTSEVGLISYDLLTNTYIVLDSTSTMLGGSSNGLILVQQEKVTDTTYEVDPDATHHPARSRWFPSRERHRTDTLEVYDVVTNRFAPHRWIVPHAWHADWLGDGLFGVRQIYGPDTKYSIIDTASSEIFQCKDCQDIVEIHRIDSNSAVAVRRKDVCIVRLPDLGLVTVCAPISYLIQSALLNDSSLLVLTQTKAKVPNNDGQSSSGVTKEGDLYFVDYFQVFYNDLTLLNIRTGQSKLIAPRVMAFALSHDKKHVAVRPYAESYRLRIVNLDGQE